MISSLVAQRSKSAWARLHSWYVKESGFGYNTTKTQILNHRVSMPNPRILTLLVESTVDLIV